MDLVPFVILGLLLILLIVAVAWSSGFSVRWKSLSDEWIAKFEAITKAAGIRESLDLRLGKTFYTYNRSIVYICVDKYSEPEVLRRGIHQLAHRYNKDSSEHGASFQMLEDRLLACARELGMEVADVAIDIHGCKQFEETSEEKASKQRTMYSFSFDPRKVL